MNINDIQVNEGSTGHIVIVYYENVNIKFDSCSENSAMHFITSNFNVGSLADETIYYVYQ